MITRKKFKHIIELHSDSLYGYIKKQLKDDSMARDFVQDSFMTLWEKRFTIRIETVKPWLYKIAYRKMLNYIRDNKRMSYKEDFLEHTYTHFSSNRMEHSDYLDYIFDQLTMDQKSIILLRDLEGYTYKEIANILEVKEGIVKNRLFQARKRFSEEVQKENNQSALI